VQELTGLRKDTLYKLIREGRFPRPIKLSTQASGWLKCEVEDFMRTYMQTPCRDVPGVHKVGRL